MKATIITLLLLSYSQVILSANEYGEKLKTDELTPISKILADAKAYEGKEVTIKGMITNVCSMRGCWMEFASDKKYQTLRIKVKDGDMVFPISAKGKLAYAKGTLSSMTVSEEKLMEYEKSYAQKEKRKPDYSKITGPKTYHQFIPSGVRIE